FKQRALTPSPLAPRLLYGARGVISSTFHHGLNCKGARLVFGRPVPRVKAILCSAGFLVAAYPPNPAFALPPGGYYACGFNASSGVPLGVWAARGAPFASGRDYSK